jgi:hypothetical protein
MALSTFFFFTYFYYSICNFIPPIIPPLPHFVLIRLLTDFMFFVQIITLPPTSPDTVIRSKIHVAMSVMGTLCSFRFFLAWKLPSPLQEIWTISPELEPLKILLKIYDRIESQTDRLKSNFLHSLIL